jgi:hypothetical protein
MPKTSFRKNSDSPLLCEVEADAGRTGAYVEFNNIILEFLEVVL